MTSTAQQLAEAEQHTAQLRAQAEAEQREALARADAARDQWDRDFMARWRDEEAAAVAAQDQAEKDFRAAVLADPVCAAYIRWRAARHRRMALVRDAGNTGRTIGAADTPAGEMTWRFPELVDALAAVAEKEAGIIGEQDSEDRYEQRAQVERDARQVAG